MNPLPFSPAIAKINYPLACATLYHMGGPADIALLPRNNEEVAEVYAWMRRQPGQTLILGGGSNVLIADEGFRGIVFFTTELKRFEDLGNNRYFVASGYDLNWLVRDIMLKHNYHGVAALAGIPGSVGGAIYMNAGTSKGSACQFLESVTLMTPSGLVERPITEEDYGYRGQRFCEVGDVILGGVFKFEPSKENEEETFAHYMRRRKEKQPQGYCCGSVFKNPEGHHAGQLIEATGLKGTRCGGAVISEIHANFIMNEGNACFQDIYTLIQRAKEAVQTQFGVALEEEVRIILSEPSQNNWAGGN